MKPEREKKANETFSSGSRECVVAVRREAPGAVRDDRGA